MTQSSGRLSKEHLFDVYAKNLELVKRNKQVKLKGERTEGYVCPVCNKIFGKDALSTIYGDHLTLEHIPPEKLGGDVKLLTCKICNNEQGSKLDKDLKEKLLMDDFLSGIPHAGRPARFLTNGKWNTGGKIFNSESGGFELRAVKDNSHHKHYHRLFKKGDLDVKKINITIYGQYKKRRPEIALLRIAYLWLYSEFGFASLINPNIDAVRQQILNPDQTIIKHIGQIQSDYPDEFEGVNIITKPHALKAFAVAFRTKTEHKERKHIVLLPGPTEPGLNIYDHLNEASKDGKKINLNLTKLNLEGVLSEPNRVFEYQDVWFNT